MSAADDLAQVERAMREALETQQENSEATVREVQRRLAEQQRQRGR